MNHKRETSACWEKQENYLSTKHLIKTNVIDKITNIEKVVKKIRVMIVINKKSVKLVKIRIKITH